MTHPLDRDSIRRAERATTLEAKRAAEQFRADVQAIMGEMPMRRVLWAFLRDMGIDATAFNTNAMAQSYAIGKQDACGWWVDAIRAHCPEREAQIRKEAMQAMNAAAKASTEDNTDDD